MKRTDVHLRETYRESLSTICGRRRKRTCRMRKLPPPMVELAGQPALIVMSQQEYDRLQALDDAFWGARAERAVAGGYASQDEVEQLVAKLADEAA